MLMNYRMPTSNMISTTLTPPSKQLHMSPSRHSLIASPRSSKTPRSALRDSGARGLLELAAANNASIPTYIPTRGEAEGSVISGARRASADETVGGRWEEIVGESKALAQEAGAACQSQGGEGKASSTAASPDCCLSPVLWV